MRALFASAVALVAAAVLAPAAGAVPLVLTNGTNLVQVDTNSLPTPSAPVAVTGLQPGEKLVGIHQRPSTGQLYGVGDTSRVYVIDPTTAAASAVASPFTPVLAGTSFGTDFNPVVDLMRQVSNDEQNLRLNPISGAVASIDTNLSPAADMVAAAYTNNVAGATTTTLYDLDYFSNKLWHQGGVDGMPSPNGGTLTEVGPTGITFQFESVGFDIGADGVAL